MNKPAGNNNDNMLRATVLLAWVLAIIWLLGGKRYESFIRPDFWPMLAGAMVLFFLFLAAVSFGRSGGHDHGHGGVKLTGAAAMLFLPLAYLPLGQQSTLGTFAYGKREVPASSAAAATPPGPAIAISITPPGSPPPAALAPARTVTLLDLLNKPEDFQGQTLTVEGMINNSKEVPEGQLVLYRFVVVCCAADARPAAVVLRGQLPPGLADDQWVHAVGRVEIGEIQGQKAIWLVADKVDKIAEPETPYIYWTPTPTGQ